jgi:hypothetical protein
MREVFSTRPRDLETVTRHLLPSTGVTRDQLQFQGRLEQAKLVFTCNAETASCPDRRMVFSRSK